MYLLTQMRQMLLGTRILVFFLLILLTVPPSSLSTGRNNGVPAENARKVQSPWYVLMRYRRCLLLLTETS